MTDTTPADAVTATRLTKRFGVRRALDAVDLRIGSGESVALVGPNGAGKTTLIRILTLGLRPDGGDFRVAGLDPRSAALEIRRRVGVLSHRASLYGRLTVLENLVFFGNLYGVENAAARSTRLLEQLRLAHRAHDPVRSLSHGLQRRVALARALIHDPQIVFLDEPFTGLDPLAADTLCSTLGRLREERRSVCLVTHDLRLGLTLTDRWLILDRGRIVDQGRSAETDPAGLERAYLAATGPRPRQAAR